MNHTFGSLGGLLATIKGMRTTYPDAEALAALNNRRSPAVQSPLVQIEAERAATEAPMAHEAAPQSSR